MYKNSLFPCMSSNDSFGQFVKKDEFLKSELFNKYTDEKERENFLKSVSIEINNECKQDDTIEKNNEKN